MILVHVGDDLQAAVMAAADGDVVHLVAGVHPGPLRITHRVTVEGERGAQISGDGHGTVVAVLADGVILRDLEVAGSGRDAVGGDAGVVITANKVEIQRVTIRDTLIGLDLQHTNDSVVHDCLIEGDPTMPMGMRGDGLRIWESERNHIEHNRFESVRDVLAWYATDNWIVDNVVHNSRYGTHLMHADGNTIAGNRYEHDVVGVFVMYSRDISLLGNTVVGAHGAAGMGFGLKESDEVRVSGNRLLGNTVGIYLDTTPQRIGGHALLSGNLIAYNQSGLRLHGGEASATIIANELHENTVQVAVDGNATATTTLFLGNKWSDFAGYDLDRDGYGDLPYELRSVSDSLTARHPGISYFAGTPAAALLDLLGAAFPMFAPHALLTDARPRLG